MSKKDLILFTLRSYLREESKHLEFDNLINKEDKLFTQEKIDSLRDTILFVQENMT